MRYEAFLARLREVRPAGEGHVALCPSHADDRHSLSVAARDGKILVRCHARQGCTARKIVEALDLTLRDLFEDNEPSGAAAASQPSSRARRQAARRIVATYAYRDEQGQVLHETVRFDPKSFAQRAPNGRGGHTWSLKGLTRRVIYRLPDLKRSP